MGDTTKITAHTTSIKNRGGEVTFDAYLDQTHEYTTGDEPTMDKVLELANYGTPWITKTYSVNGRTVGGNPAKPTVGKKGFWERAEKKIEKDLKKTMRAFFK